MPWTDERVDLLKKMWNEGQSAGRIAKELGGVTRNAVIGKVHRLGLSNRAGLTAEGEPIEPEVPHADPASDAPAVEPAAPDPEPIAETPEEAETEEPAATPQRQPIVPAGQPLPPQPSANEVSAETLAEVREVEKSAKKLSLMELTERTCKWPVGDPATEDFWFCGLPTQTGKPYCEAHVNVAFQPMSSRRDRRR